jgi:phosphatidate cytidylyltransferase
MNEFIKRVSTGFSLGLFFWLAFAYLPPIYFSIILFIILLFIIAFEWKRLFNTHSPAFWLLMPLYPILPFALLISMNNTPAYRELLFILFVIVFSHDTGSYIMGKLLGKHKIMPRISPGKSWEGFIGGYLFACIGLAFMFWEHDLNEPWPLTLFFTLLICLLALIGDFFESWLKRRAAIKDSGNFLPGHGGFLDRFDGIMFAAFFFFVFKDFLVRLFKITV